MSEKEVTGDTLSPEIRERVLRIIAEAPVVVNDSPDATALLDKEIRREFEKQELS